MINIGDEETGEVDPGKFSAIDQWILDRLNEVIKTTDELYEAFEFGEVARIIYHFVWDDLASWYIELTKAVLRVKAGISIIPKLFSNICSLPSASYCIRLCRL